MEIWNIENIKAGFDKFFIENGHYPTAPEIDATEYLPSSRQIQRKFGGLLELRKVLGYKDISFGSGDFRRTIANSTNKLGFDSERQVEELLIARFGEPFVHIERRFGLKRNRVDFYVFAQNGRFGVDVFHTQSFRDLQKNVNIKIDKYGDFSEKLVFLAFYKDFNLEKLNSWLLNKRKVMNKNIEILTPETFSSFIVHYEPFENPLTAQ